MDSHFMWFLYSETPQIIDTSVSYTAVQGICDPFVVIAQSYKPHNASDKFVD